MSTENRDIVERLHEAWREPLERLERDGLDFEAATEIAHLRAELAHERAVNEAALRKSAESEGEAMEVDR